MEQTIGLEVKKVTNTGTIVLSPNGKSREVISSGTDAQGNKFKSTPGTINYSRIRFISLNYRHRRTVRLPEINLHQRIAGVPLTLDTREVGRVTIVRCNGRIVAGTESDALRAHISWLLRDRRAIVLHLGEVGFIDSSGLGAIVRCLTSTRRARGDLKLCNVPERLRELLELSRLTAVLAIHESEEKAISAFNSCGLGTAKPIPTGCSILCLDFNLDVLAYLRELLRRAGYDVHTSSHLADARLLIRATKFDLLLTSSEVTAFPAAQDLLHSIPSSLPIIEMPSELPTRNAGEAGAELLEKIESRLRYGTSN
jgi:anti-sigma B factor antagonist